MEQYSDDLSLLSLLQIDSVQLLKGLQVVIWWDDGLEDCLLDICDHMVHLGYLANLIWDFRATFPVSRSLPLTFSFFIVIILIRISRPPSCLLRLCVLKRLLHLGQTDIQRFYKKLAGQFGVPFEPRLQVLDTADLHRHGTFVVLYVLKLQDQEFELLIHRIAFLFDTFQALLSLETVPFLSKEVKNSFDWNWVFLAKLQSNVVQNEDEYFYVTLGERREHEFDYVEEQVTPNWLEQEQVHKAIHDVFDPHNSHFFPIFIDCTHHLSVVFFESWHHSLKHFCKERCTTESMQRCHKHTIHWQKLVHLLLLWNSQNDIVACVSFVVGVAHLFVFVHCCFEDLL